MEEFWYNHSKRLETRTRELLLNGIDAYDIEIYQHKSSP